MAVLFREWQGQYQSYLIGKSEADVYQLYLKYAPNAPIEAQVSTAGDLIVDSQAVDPEPLWKSAGFDSYEDYVADFKDRAVVTAGAQEILIKRQVAEMFGLPDPVLPQPASIKIIEEVHKVGVMQVNSLDPEFPAENLIQVGPENYVQAFYQITETGSKYPISNVSSEGGTVSVTSPPVKEMPWGAVIERWRHTIKQNYGFDPLHAIVVGIAVIGVIILAVIARRR